MLKVIDSISEWVGSIGRWLVVALVAVTVYDVIARYVFDAPTIWGFETSRMLGGSIILFGWAYCQLHHSHIRVDIFYTRFSRRKKALIDVVCSMLLFFPLFAILIKTSIPWMWSAWQVGEVMPESFWYPPAGPFRTVIVIGVCLLFLQFIAQFVRDLRILIKH